MSDSVKVVIETNGDKISSVWTSAKHSMTAILDWESIDIVRAKHLLEVFGDTLSMGAKSKLTDIIIQSEKEKDLKALDSIIGSRFSSPLSPFLRKLIEYCKKNPSVSISDAIQKLMNGVDKL